MFARAGGVVDLVEIFLSSSSIIVQNLATASHTVRAHVGLQIFGTLEPRPLAWGVADSLETRSSRTCYRAKFSRFGSNATSVITETRWKKIDPS